MSPSANMLHFIVQMAPPPEQGEGDPYSGLIMLALIGGTWALVKLIKKRNAQRNLGACIATIPDLANAPRFVGVDRLSGIALNTERKKVGIAKTTEGTIPTAQNVRVLEYSDVIQAAVIEDGVGVSETSRSSQIGGAIVGGLLLGGVGAIIGGLSGKKKNSQEVHEITLRIVLNDPINPVVEIAFFRGTTKKGSVPYKQAMGAAVDWHSRLTVVIRQADEAAKAADRAALHAATQGAISPQAALPSSSDELHKLAALLEKGLLTKEEFEHQKKKILGL